MSIQEIKKYLSSSVQAPYFFVVGDKDYKDIKENLSELGFSFVKASDYCNDDDKIPDIDNLIQYLTTANDKKLAVIGLGEYLALRGKNENESILSHLKDLNIEKAKVVLLLRGVTAQIKDIQQADLRFDHRRFFILDEAECNLSVTLTSNSVGLTSIPGFKSLLIKLENGTCENITVSTKVNLDSSLFTIHKLTNAYEGIKFFSPNFNLPRSSGSDEYWAELLKELTQNCSLDEIFEKYSFDNNLESNFYDRISGLEYRNWLYFIALKSKLDTLSNGYLRFVLDKTNRFEEFKTNTLNSIIEIPHTDKRYSKFYKERKKLIEKFPESDIADFVINNRKNTTESIFKLTDKTKTEREEIIAWISQNGMVPQIADIYPALTAYLKKYIFNNCGDLSNILTDYFDEYKRQKISNRIEDNFNKKVENLAKSREYNRLPTRNEVIDGLNKTDAYLYWLDALGAEYLAFITELARERGLNISIKIARAELPTITSFNSDFFHAWQGDKNDSKDLDEIKHKEKGGYNFEKNDLPIHLAEELDIIKNVIEKAATELAHRHYKYFLIVSDHGASRLAVLRRKEEQYETDTKGEHSGRCCKFFEPYDLPFAAEENGYLVLADYGRFKGSRAASVEVHGGASLEEVVVPIIELSLKDNSKTVDMVEEFVTVDYRTGTKITLFSKSPLENVYIVFNGKHYSASKFDNNHYSVDIPDLKRAGNYSADVYEGDNLIGKIQIKAQGKSGKVNDAFEELF